MVLWPFGWCLAQNVNDGFDPNANGRVEAVEVQPDGYILTGGLFSEIGGFTRALLARLRPDGSLDATFDANLSGTEVRTIAVQPDGRIIAGGSFGQAGISVRNNIARFQPGGSLDTGFNPNANDTVRALAVAPDGKILIGADFSEINGQTRSRIARLSTPEATHQELLVAGNTVVWHRSGPGPELALPPELLFSLDGQSFSSGVTMDRVAGGWALSGFEPPFDQLFYLRVRGRMTGGFNYVSQGLIEYTRQSYIILREDPIFTDRFEAMQ